MDVMDLIQSLARWAHVVAGILWIGLLYFFNWVNSAVVPTLDADSKRKVLPELLPRALYWFRWGAAWTWITGVILLALVFYHGKIVFEDPAQGWGLPAIVSIVITFLGVYIYDFLQKSAIGKNPNANFFVLWILASAVAVFVFGRWAGFGARSQLIHLGAMFGSTMAFNVWYRIWPAQQKVIAAIKAGEAPDAKLAGLAGTRSKHNTYMSVPLVFTMLNSHNVWAWGQIWAIPVVILVGWLIVRQLYAHAPKIKGF